MTGADETSRFNEFLGNRLIERADDPAARDRVMSAVVDGAAIVVRWADGQEARFSSRWLRFNCFCQACGTSDDGIRVIDLTMIPSDIAPSAVALRAENLVAVDWHGNTHESVYGGEWLRAHANTPQERDRRRRWRPTTWRTRPFEDLPAVDYQGVVDDDHVRLAMFEALRDQGIVRVNGVGPDPELTVPLANQFGPIHETVLYGRVFDVQATPSAQLGGETAIHQHPHCDDTFHYSPPGIVLFHFISNEIVDGGVSSYADGFAIAESIRDEAPEAFRLLTSEPVQFIRRRPGHFDLRGEGRIIRLNDRGEIAGIRFFDRSTAPLDADEHLVDAMLDAQTEFLRRLVSPDFQVTHRLEAGDVVVVDNHRVLHGRTAFDPTTVRRLRTCTVNRDEFHGRWRELAHRLGRDDYDLVLSSGAV